MHNILSKKVPDFVPVFLYAVIMLITQIKIIIYSEKWFNLVRRCLFFFFFLMLKIWVCQTTLNGEKKDGLTAQSVTNTV